MSGTTLCPHCDTHFRIEEAQLESHCGMVRCGHCLQAFDARPGYVADQPSPQLELPILDEPAATAAKLPPKKPDTAEATHAIDDAVAIGETCPADAIPSADEMEGTKNELTEFKCCALPDFIKPYPAQSGVLHTADELQPDGHDTQTGGAIDSGLIANESLQEFHFMTLPEQVAIAQGDEMAHHSKPVHRKWRWVVAALLLLLLLAQASYFFRIDLAVRLPRLKPALTGTCRLLGCSVPLPQRADLLGIESSGIEADPLHESHITLNALLRNHAPYAQEFPNLELSLNDTQDKPLARRVFKPEDYLPPQESEQTGLLPNHETSVKLYLDTADLRPAGYRLALFYAQR